MPSNFKFKFELASKSLIKTAMLYFAQLGHPNCRAAEVIFALNLHASKKPMQPLFSTHIHCILSYYNLNVL